MFVYCRNPNEFLIGDMPNWPSGRGRSGSWRRAASRWRLGFDEQCVHAANMDFEVIRIADVIFAALGAAHPAWFNRARW